ncbi:MAG: 2-phosphosulfolactate phosphatase, partial [Candidatus Zixiibacteriota bacterium]
TVLGGERKGVRIENFTHGNSPLEYNEDTVAGKIVILTTTNGTQLYSKAKHSKLAITCGLVNISTVASHIVRAGNDVAILCAGEEGDFSIEDSLCGGMIIHKLRSEFNLELKLNDAAALVLLLYQSYSGNLQEAIANGEHGRYLTEIGFAEDVGFASRIDSIPVLPVLKDRRIVLAEN